MSRSEGHDTNRAIDIYTRYVSLSARSEPVDFDALCASHPDLAEELRALKNASANLDALLPGPLASQAQSPKSAAPQGLLSKLLAVGRARFARYRILEEIGRGGMGIVYRAWDRELDRELAMKVMRPQSGTWDERTRQRLHERFLQEARITGWLDHPGIVTINELGITNTGDLFFVMRLVKGESLRSIFRHVHESRRGWTRNRALSVIVGVCQTMSHAHHRGIIHRDLKPGNIMVGEFGESYVVDWGLARCPDRGEIERLHSPFASQGRDTETDGIESAPSESALMTTEGQSVGTPAFMSPEQARGDHECVGPASDIYAIGAMLYQLLSGTAPYSELPAGVTARQILAHVAASKPKPLSELGRPLPPELAAICERAMAPAPEQRYPDMVALALDLRAYLDGGVVTAHGTGRLLATRKWVMRNRLLAGLSACAILLLGIAAYLLPTWRRSSEQERMRRALSDVAAFQTWAADWEVARQPGPPLLEEWLKRSQVLVEQLTPFEALYRPATAEQVAAAAPSFPGAKEIARLEADVSWWNRVLGEEPWPDEAMVRAECETMMEGLRLPSQIAEFNDRIFRLIRPDEPRKHGHERTALRMAESLVRFATEHPETPAEHRGRAHPRYLDTLATAQWRCGLFERAVATQREAAKAPFWDSGGYTAETWRQDVVATLGFFERQARMAKTDALRRLRDRLTFAVDLLKWDRDAHAFAVAGEAKGEERARAVATLGLLRHRRRLAEEAAPTGRFGRAWQETIAAVRASRLYGGLELSPQVGLVPLEPDPESGLFEFADLFSGEPPDRMHRALDIDSNSATVFVLLPSGTLPVEQGSNPGPEHKKLLPAFFLSKYEFTDHQLQYLGAPLRDLAQFASEIRAVPAYGLSWAYCSKALLGSWAWLRLPTGIEWEYGCRGGTTTRWWNGDDVRDIQRVARIGLPRDAKIVDEVGARPPNPFGFVDVCGNVAEWCLDTLPERDPIAQQTDAHMARGGCSTDDPAIGASGRITFYLSNNHVHAIGMRPARCLTR